MIHPITVSLSLLDIMFILIYVIRTIFKIVRLRKISVEHYTKKRVFFFHLASLLMTTVAIIIGLLSLAVVLAVGILSIEYGRWLKKCPIIRSIAFAVDDITAQYENNPQYVKKLRLYHALLPFLMEKNLRKWYKITKSKYEDYSKSIALSSAFVASIAGAIDWIIYNIFFNDVPIDTSLILATILTVPVVLIYHGSIAYIIGWTLMPIYLSWGIDVYWSQRIKGTEFSKIL